jgi:hypothetical protein
VTVSCSRLLLFLLPLLCSTYFFPRWADVNVNSRLDMVVALVHDGTARIDRYVHNTVDYAIVDGHYYSDKAPGAALLGVPLYAAFALLFELPIVQSMAERLADHGAFRATLREDGTGVSVEKVRFALAQVWLSFALAAVPTALLCVLMHDYLLLHGASRGATVAVPLLYALASPAFAYANAFYGHQLAALLLFAAFVIVCRSVLNSERAGEDVRGNLPADSKGKAEISLGFFTGLLLGYAVVTEYPAVIVAGIIFVYAAWNWMQRRRLGALFAMSAGGAICAALLMLYNTLVFGGPLQLGYARSTLWTAQHSTGLFSLGLPQPEVFYELTLGIFRGLFVLSPVLLLAVPGFVVWLRSGDRRGQALVALAATGGMLLFNASSAMWWGGWGVGPRYMLPGLPFMALALSFVLRSSGGWRAMLVLGAASVVATWSMTTAGQSFPSDALRNPWIDHVLPAWAVGDIARSWGTLLGMRGLAALMPLVFLGGITLGLWRWTGKRSRI